MSKSKFVKFLGRAHINAMNLALYASGAVRAENVINGKCVAARQFESTEAAQEWFDGFDGNNTDRSVSAIAALIAHE